MIVYFAFLSKASLPKYKDAGSFTSTYNYSDPSIKRRLPMAKEKAKKKAPAAKKKAAKKKAPAKKTRSGANVAKVRKAVERITATTKRICRNILGNFSSYTSKKSEKKPRE